MKGSGFVQTLVRTLIAVVGAGLPLSIDVILAQGLGGAARERHLQEHSRFETQFRSGDTNAPLLAMDWFSEHGVYFCRVTQGGSIYSARDVGHAIQGGSGISSRFSLGNTSRSLFEDLLNHLPPSDKSLPLARQILVSGIRSNQWFAFVYDRADVPSPIEKLYEFAGAYLEWFIPEIVGHCITRMHTNNFMGNFRAVSIEGSVSVSFGHWVTNHAYYYPPILEVLDLQTGVQRTAHSFKGLPNVPAPWEAVAISSDGKIAITAIANGVYAVDCESGNLLWKSDPLDHEDYFGTALAISDKSKTLFAAGAHSVERRHLLNGRILGSLGTNELIVKFLKISRDGSILAGGFGGANSSSTSFALWETGTDLPTTRFSSPHGASVGVSPDGEVLALSHWPEKELEIWHWRTGERQRVPLRAPYGAHSAYSLTWSPDGKLLAAYVDTYPASVVLYETTAWKPLAHWPCGQIGGSSEFIFSKGGTLLQVSGGEINGLEVAN